MRGFLTFDYPNQYSRLREKHILDILEEEIIDDCLRLSIQVNSSLFGAACVNNPKNISKFDMIDKYISMKLPWEKVSVKITKEEKIKKMAEWVKSMHASKDK